MLHACRGRNEQMLDRLAGLSSRVVPVPITDDQDGLVKALTKDGPVDAYLDLSPPGISSGHLRSAIKALRKGGRVSLMGGIGADLPWDMGTIVFNDIELKGQWMYSSTVVRDMVKLVASTFVPITSESFTDQNLFFTGVRVARPVAGGGSR